MFFCFKSESTVRLFTEYKLGKILNFIGFTSFPGCDAQGERAAIFLDFFKNLCFSGSGTSCVDAQHFVCRQETHRKKGCFTLSLPMSYEFFPEPGLAFLHVCL